MMMISPRTAIPPTTPPATAPTETCEPVLEVSSAEEVVGAFELWPGLALFDVVVVAVTVAVVVPFFPAEIVGDVLVPMDVVAPVAVVPVDVAVDDVVVPLVVVVVPTGATGEAGSTCLCQQLVNVNTVIGEL